MSPLPQTPSVRAQRGFLLPLLLSASCLFALFCALSPLPATPPQAAKLPRASDVVKPEIYLSLAPVPRGRAVEIAVVARILPGFHINSHQPREEYLIPTNLTVDLSPGVQALSTAYPPGALRKFQFSPSELSVYEGSATLRLKLHVSPRATLGPRTLSLTLRYQACNDEACLPPVNLPLSAEITIAPAGAHAHPQHPEIFSAPGLKGK
jgi:thiol:disulfide interchange protein DsbD